MKVVAVIVAVSSLLAFGVASLATLVLMGQLRPYRTDLRRGEPYTRGPSAMWQRNVYMRANYRPEARRLLRRLYLCTALQGASMLLWLASTLVAMATWAG